MQFTCKNSFKTVFTSDEFHTRVRVNSEGWKITSNECPGTVQLFNPKNQCTKILELPHYAVMDINSKDEIFVCDTTYVGRTITIYDSKLETVKDKLDLDELIPNLGIILKFQIVNDMMVIGSEKHFGKTTYILNREGKLLKTFPFVGVACCNSFNKHLYIQDRENVIRCFDENFEELFSFPLSYECYDMCVNEKNIFVSDGNSNKIKWMS